SMSVGWQQILIILVIALLLFGGGSRISNMMGEFAKGIKAFKKGDKVKAKILAIDIEKERISLGIKQLADNPMDSEMSDIAKGAVVTVTVTAVPENGIEVKVSDNVISFIKKSDLSKERQDQRTERFAVGDRVVSTRGYPPMPSEP
ncbi:MAG: S1 RNA-binding domain-containing protein, partial [Verrucomicrobiales bacterium]